MPAGQILLETGAGATRARALSPEMADFRILHFATHGSLDAEQPLLSALVLAQRDERGREIDGLLRAHEIYGRELAAELVVLAACETGLGQERAGEGLISGLPRAFLAAGARRVLVSLWKVGDRDSRDLMKAFYRGLVGRPGPGGGAARRRSSSCSGRAGRPAPGRVSFCWEIFRLSSSRADPRRTRRGGRGILRFTGGCHRRRSLESESDFVRRRAMSRELHIHVYDTPNPADPRRPGALPGRLGDPGDDVYVAKPDDPGDDVYVAKPDDPGDDVYVAKPDDPGDPGSRPCYATGIGQPVAVLVETRQGQSGSCGCSCACASEKPRRSPGWAAAHLHHLHAEISGELRAYGLSS